MIFKREKELARKLEFDGLYITEQPEDDDIKGQWDRLVLNTPYANTETVPFLVPFRYLIKQPKLNQDSVIISVTTEQLFFFYSSFPNNYWDKFVKRKVSRLYFLAVVW